MSKKKLTAEETEVALDFDDDSWHKTVILERRQAKVTKKVLATRPEKKYVPPKKKF